MYQEDVTLARDAGLESDSIASLEAGVIRHVNYRYAASCYADRGVTNVTALLVRGNKGIET